MKHAQLLSLFAAAAGAAVLKTKAANYLNYPGIQFGSDRKLSISVFSDLHFGELYRPGADVKTVGVMNSVLENEQPDFVVLNGDLISCEWVAFSQVNGLIDQLVAPLVERNLPFGATFGNHDMSKTCLTPSSSAHMWWDIKGMNGKKLSFTTQSVSGDANKVGWSNYFVPVYSSTNSQELKMLLWFFDSKGGNQYNPTGGDIGVPSEVDEKVVEWFTKTRDMFAQQYGRTIPSLAFVHIPVHATNTFQNHGRSKTANPDINQEYIGQQGDKCDIGGKNCNYDGSDIPFMKALVETGGLMAVFSGHDHGVDWCMKWSKDLPDTSPANGNGLNMCFNRHTGYGGYSDWARGARQIVVEEDKLGQNVVETWIRLENGKISGQVSLNSTFGTDQYPQVPAEKSWAV